MQANPSDILLFHKRRQAETAKGGKASASRKKRSAAGLDVPVEPEDLEQINIEDLIIENLANNDKKLELLDERSMGEGMYCVLPWIMYYTSILIVGVCNILFSLDVGASWSSLVLRVNSFSDYDRHHSLGAIRR